MKYANIQKMGLMDDAARQISRMGMESMNDLFACCLYVFYLFFLLSDLIVASYICHLPPFFKIINYVLYLSVDKSIQ